MQANLRSEIFKTLHETHSVPKGPTLCQENLVINELIREYLEYNKHQNSLSVFQLETKTPRHGIDREFVKGDLNLEESGSNMQKLPLIYGIVSMLQSIDQHKKIQTAFSNAKSNNRLPSQARQPSDDIRLGLEPNHSIHSTFSDDALSHDNAMGSKNRILPDSGRQSSASVGMAGYSANDFEFSSENDDSSIRRKTPSLSGSGGPSREASFNGYADEKYDDYDEDDEDDDDDYLSNSVKVMAVEDLAPVE
ncbi:uncharacterized protein LOC142342204 [Convolutriloba macropyga]|uniref:uncharacterized protein LOC142342204 n=1 Tax=Convolutriloba macropyga TaxID=536237 RepID=UPI003F520E62